MTRLLHALNFDLILERSGHRCHIGGTGDRLTVTLPSLPSAIHFARAFWPLRSSIPRETIVSVVYGPIRWKLRGTARLESLWNS